MLLVLLTQSVRVGSLHETQCFGALRNDRRRGQLHIVLARLPLALTYATQRQDQQGSGGWPVASEGYWDLGGSCTLDHIFL